MFLCVLCLHRRGEGLFCQCGIDLVATPWRSVDIALSVHRRHAKTVDVKSDIHPTSARRMLRKHALHFGEALAGGLQRSGIGIHGVLQLAQVGAGEGQVRFQLA